MVKISMPKFIALTYIVTIYSRLWWFWQKIILSACSFRYLSVMNEGLHNDIYRFPMICNIIICFISWHFSRNCPHEALCAQWFTAPCTVSYFRFYITRYHRQRKICIYIFFIHAPHRELSRRKYRVYGKSEIFEDISVIEDLT